MNFKLINPKEHKQLFLDDHVIESMKGIKKSLHQPQKWGSVIKSGYQSRISPQWNTEKKIWEWWYMGENIHYTISTDGEHWEKPSLGLYEWNGSKDNNIVCNPEGDGHQRPFHIICDQSDPDPPAATKACLVAVIDTLAFPMMALTGPCLIHPRYPVRMNPSSPMIHLRNNTLLWLNNQQNGAARFFSLLVRIS